MSDLVPSPKVGTAGWSYPHWQGIVYPKVRPTGFHALELLAKHIGVVEINSSFYQPLKPEVVRLWMKQAQAHDDFQFTAKLYQRFTHARILEDSEVGKFKEGLWPLPPGAQAGDGIDAVPLVLPFYG